MPFTGGNAGDGEIMSTLLSFQNEIMKEFSIVSTTNAVKAMVTDQYFQLMGMSDSDYISRIGTMLGADYVISGSIRNLGDRNLIIATIIDTKSLQLLAGEYREYRRREEIPAQLDIIARSMIAGSKRDTSGLSKIAIAPVSIPREGINAPEAETLVQIMAIDLANTGLFAVLPRLTAIGDILRRPEYHSLGYIVLGQSINVNYVLASEVRNTGSSHIITASIYNVDGRDLLAESSRNYQSIRDGIAIASELGSYLAGECVVPFTPRPGQSPQIAEAAPAQTRPETPVQIPQAVPVQPFTQPLTPVQIPQTVPVQPSTQPLTPAQTPLPEQVPLPSDPTITVQPAPETEKPSLYRRMFSDPSRLWTVGISGGTSLTLPWLIITVHGTAAFFNNIILELGFDFGLISGSSEVTSYYSMYPYAHIAYFLPFANLGFLPFNRGGVYAGAGAGYMMVKYTFPEGPIAKNILAADIIAGINLFDMIDISYTLRTDFSGISNKLSIGYVYRIK